MGTVLELTWCWENISSCSSAAEILSQGLFLQPGLSTVLSQGERMGSQYVFINLHVYYQVKVDPKLPVTSKLMC